MAAERKTKKELENQIRDVRQQLTDQLRCLDQKVDCHLGMVWELQEYYRRHAEVEMEYARNLEKVDKQIRGRHKAEKQRREQWASYSTFETWQTLLQGTRKRSRDHSVLAELYNSVMVARLGDLMEDMQRVHRKCRDVLSGYQEELIKVLNELLSTMKSYHTYYSDSQQAENKLLRAQSHRVKNEQAPSALGRRFRRDLDKLSEKKQAKYTENKLKALKARNEYLLAIDFANAAVFKYFNDDVPMLIEKMDVGYRALLAQITNTHIKMEDCLIRNQKESLDCFSGIVWAVGDNPADREKFRTLNNKVFSTPEAFEFQSHKGDEICQLSAQKAIQDYMLERLNGVRERLDENNSLCVQLLQSLGECDRLLMDRIKQLDDIDVSMLFGEEKPPLKSPTDKDKKAELVDIEDKYITEISKLLRAGNLVARLQAKYDSLQKALGEGFDEVTTDNNSTHVIPKRPPSLPPKPKKSRYRPGEQPKLFGGNLEDHIDKAQPVPQIILSCVRLVNLYGMHHQGIFRVPGSQADINTYKQEFEQGNDPLDGKVDGDDINSVAGLLKLYFRELKEPMFPRALFDPLIECTQKYNVCDADQEKEWKAEIRSILSKVPQSVCVVMRYLFAFLNHLSEFSDENMMDASNLAICFGPTLLPIPDGRDQVQFQLFVNELIKNMIIHYETVLPFDGGITYEKYIAEDDGDKDYADAMSDDDMLSTTGPICEHDEDEEEGEAIAQFDFQGRTGRELSFKKGDVIILHARKSVDWWEGSTGGNKGLIPDKYIKIKTQTRGLKVDDSLRKSTECLSTDSVSALSHASSHPNIAMLAAVMQSGTELMKPELDGRRSVSPGRRSGPQNATEIGVIDDAYEKVMSSIKSLDEMDSSTHHDALSRETSTDITRSFSDKSDMKSFSSFARTQPTTLKSSDKIDSNKNILGTSTTVPIVVKPPSPIDSHSNVTEFPNFNRGKTKAATLPKTANEFDAFKVLEISRNVGGDADMASVTTNRPSTDSRSSSAGRPSTDSRPSSASRPSSDSRPSTDSSTSDEVKQSRTVLSRTDSAPQQKDGNVATALTSTLPRSVAESQNRSIPVSVPIVPVSTSSPSSAPALPPKPQITKKPASHDSPKSSRPADVTSKK